MTCATCCSTKSETAWCTFLDESHNESHEPNPPPVNYSQSHFHLCTNSCVISTSDIHGRNCLQMSHKMFSCKPPSLIHVLVCILQTLDISAQDTHYMYMTCHFKLHTNSCVICTSDIFDINCLRMSHVIFPCKVSSMSSLE